MKVKRKKTGDSEKPHSSLGDPKASGLSHPVPKRGGRPTGSGSMINWLKWRLKGEPLEDLEGQYETLADELAGVALKRAQSGSWQFVESLMKHAHGDAVTTDDLDELVEIVFTITSKYVLKLEGGQQAMELIAQELSQELEGWQ